MCIMYFSPSSYFILHGFSLRVLNMPNFCRLYSEKKKEKIIATNSKFIICVSLKQMSLSLCFRRATR